MERSTPLYTKGMNRPAIFLSDEPFRRYSPLKYFCPFSPHFCRDLGINRKPCLLFLTLFYPHITGFAFVDCRQPLWLPRSLPSNSFRMFLDPWGWRGEMVDLWIRLGSFWFWLLSLKHALRLYHFRMLLLIKSKGLSLNQLDCLISLRAGAP